MAVVNINPISMAQAPASVTPAAQQKPIRVERQTGGSDKALDAAKKEADRRAEYSAKESAARNSRLYPVNTRIYLFLFASLVLQ